MKKIVLLLLFGSYFIGCKPQKPAIKTEPVTDLLGRTVSVPIQPTKILAMGPGAVRLIYYLQAQDKLVGIEAFDKKPEYKGRVYRYVLNTEKMRIFAPGGPQSVNKEPDLEAVLRSGTQLIFAASMQKEVADKIQAKIKIPVVVVNYAPRFASISEDFFTSLKLIAKIMGKESRSQQIIDYYQKFLKDIEHRVAKRSSLQHKKIFIGGVGYRGTHGLTSTDANYLPLTWLKVPHLATKYAKDKHILLDKEELLKANPDILLIDGFGLKNIRNEYQKNPKYFQALSAVQKRQVYLLFPFNFYTTNLGTALVDTYIAGKILYPAQFSDIELKAKADEIYEFFYGKKLYDSIIRDFGNPEKNLVLGK